MASETESKFTPTQYLALEDTAEQRSEYYRGTILPVAPLTFHHKAVVRDIFVALSLALKERPCRIFVEAFRLFVEPAAFFTYPDVMVVCGEVRFAAGRDDTLMNPTVIFEVSSAATREYDLGMKFDRFRLLPTLREYVVLDSQRVEVRRMRHRVGQWVTATYENFDEMVELESLDCRIRVAEFYKTVEF